MDHIKVVFVQLFVLNHDLNWAISKVHTAVFVQVVVAYLSICVLTLLPERRDNYLLVVEELLQEFVKGHLQHFVWDDCSIEHISAALVTVHVDESCVISLKLLSCGLLNVARIFKIFDLNTSISVVEVVCVVKMWLTTAILRAEKHR